MTDGFTCAHTTLWHRQVTFSDVTLLNGSIQRGWSLSSCRCELGCGCSSSLSALKFPAERGGAADVLSGVVRVGGVGGELAPAPRPLESLVRRRIAPGQLCRFCSTSAPLAALASYDTSRGALPGGFAIWRGCFFLGRTASIWIVLYLCVYRWVPPSLCHVHRLFKPVCTACTFQNKQFGCIQSDVLSLQFASSLRCKRFMELYKFWWKITGVQQGSAEVLRFRRSSVETCCFLV